MEDNTNLFKHAPKELVTDAFLTWLFNIFAQIIAFVIGAIVFLGSIGTLLDKFGL